MNKLREYIRSKRKPKHKGTVYPGIEYQREILGDMNIGDEIK